MVDTTITIKRYKSPMIEVDFRHRFTVINSLTGKSLVSEKKLCKIPLGQFKSLTLRNPSIVWDKNYQS